MAFAIDRLKEVRNVSTWAQLHEERVRTAPKTYFQKTTDAWADLSGVNIPPLYR